MKFALGLFVFCYALHAQALDNCTIDYTSNITSDWTVGITVAQTTIAAMQVVLGLGVIIFDSIFYHKRHGPEVEAREHKLAALQKEYQMLKQEEPMLVYLILEKIKNCIEKDPAISPEDEQQIIEKLGLVRDTLAKIIEKKP